VFVLATLPDVLTRLMLCLIFVVLLAVGVHFFGPQK
jgi:hypothetical protein